MINKLFPSCEKHINKLKTKVSKLCNPIKIANSKILPLPCDKFDKANKTDIAGVIEQSVKKFPNFKPEERLYSNMDEYLKKSPTLQKTRHEKRMKLFASFSERTEPRLATKQQKKAADMIQHELGEYFRVQTKLRNGDKLNSEEQIFYDFIKSAMEETKTEKTVWRYVRPYDGFVEQIREGQINFNGFSSTLSGYTDFFDFWGSPVKKIVGNKIQVTDGYMLKINLKPGTPILDCNLVHKPLVGKTKLTFISDEVVLPEGKGFVKGINEALKVIDIDFFAK